MTTLYAMHFGTFILSDLEDDDGLTDFKGGDDDDVEESLAKIDGDESVRKHVHGEPSQSDKRGVGAASENDED